MRFNKKAAYIYRSLSKSKCTDILNKSVYLVLLLPKPVNPVFLRKFYSALLLISTLLTGQASFAQDHIKAIDSIFSWVKQNEPGCVCAVSQNGKLIANRAYGLADLERDVPLSTNSILDAGSVVKQFVVASVLMLVEDGKLNSHVSVIN